MEISIQRYISDGGALKIKQPDKHLTFLTLSFDVTDRPSSKVLSSCHREDAHIITVNPFVRTL